MPGFYVRDRPDRASPRKTQKAGDFPAESPANPASPTSPGQSSFTCSIPGRSPKSKDIGGSGPDGGHAEGNGVSGAVTADHGDGIVDLRSLAVDADT